MRSRVMPGSSVTMERRAPTMRLRRVDLPTLGRPTMAIRGSGDDGMRVENIDWSSFSLTGRRWPEGPDEGVQSPKKVFLAVPLTRRFAPPSPVGRGIRLKILLPQ